MPPNALSDWLKGQLRHREWTQADFAKRSGFSSGVVSNWLRGERVPTPESCDRIADVLGVDVDLVLTLAGHRPATEKVDPNDPGAEIIGLVRRIDWTRPSRADTMRVMLRLYLDEDRRRRQ